MESVAVRQLVEHSTGLYTGAMETNASLVDLLHGEGFCGQRLAAVQASPRDVTIKLARSAHGVVSLTNSGKRKCMKGMIRGFSRAVLVLRDPFAFSWELAANLTRAKRGKKDREIPPDPDFDALLLRAANNFTVNDLEVSHAYQRLKTSFVNDRHNVWMISYEALFDPIHAHRMSALTDLLTFLNYPDALQERKECSFQFVSVAARVDTISSMHRYLLHSSRLGLLCQMQRVLHRALEPILFNFTFLYKSINCV
jgi:hypothetical protein